MENQLHRGLFVNLVGISERRGRVFTKCFLQNHVMLRAHSQQTPSGTVLSFHLRTITLG